ncbi:conserved hypothetical protein [Mesorhizobium plurifarium]|uniref:Uncharacterized protein n=1 Tax=Mesorhizobium plurifarium TaxID=69974 RepID=A0A0K2VYK9_MESPL|nr:conserved hypothetical protein [Mesorhizobium plurifarium]
MVLNLLECFLHFLRVVPRIAVGCACHLSVSISWSASLQTRAIEDGFRAPSQELPISPGGMSGRTEEAGPTGLGLLRQMEVSASRAATPLSPLATSPPRGGHKAGARLASPA